MGLFGIEKIEKDKGTFIDSSQVTHHKPNKKVDNLAEMDKIVLEKKAQEDLKRQQEEEAKKVQELVEQQKKADLEAQAKVEADYLASLDPLDNANNPVPVNPVAPKEEKVVKESLGFGGLLKIIFGMILHPGDILEEKPDKYGTLVNGLKLSLVLTILTVVFSLAARVLTGMFVKDYNSITGAYNTRFDINNIFLQDYAYYLITAVVISGVSILIISLIYYISSFSCISLIYFSTTDTSTSSSSAICSIDFFFSNFFFIIRRCSCSIPCSIPILIPFSIPFCSTPSLKLHIYSTPSSIVSVIGI